MTEVVLHIDGSVTRPGPGYSADGLTDEWVRNNSTYNENNDPIIPSRPEVLTETELLSHSIYTAKLAGEETALKTKLAVPTVQDIIDYLEEKNPGDAEGIQSKSNIRAGV